MPFTTCSPPQRIIIGVHLETTLRSRLAIYQWSAWVGFLAEAVADGAQVIDADCHHTSAELLHAIDADVTGFLFHIDLTFTTEFPKHRPLLLSGLDARGIRALNGSVVDISKRSLQSVLRRLCLPSLTADPDGDPDERVIVKSNLNAHGHPERRLSATDRAALDLPRNLDTIDPYEIVRRRDVPLERWQTPAVSVERFVDNPRGRFFRAYVAGHSLIVCESLSPAPIKKMGYGLPRSTFLFRLRHTPEPLHATPNRICHVARDVWTLVGEMRLDFGTVDLVEDERGAVYICDVNSTPYWNEHEPDIVTFLRAGLTSLCQRD